LGFGEGRGLIGFKLEQVVAALLDDEPHGRGLAVEGVGGDERVVQFGLRVEAAGGGEFAFLSGLIGAGGRGGDGHGHGGGRLVFAQAKFDSFEVADTLAGEGLANEVQEGVGFAELRVGDFRRLECFFFESGWASWARVSWSVTVMYCSDNCWKRR